MPIKKKKDVKKIIKTVNKNKPKKLDKKPIKKVVVKKAVAKKTVAKKTVAKKTVVKKVIAKKTLVKKEVKKAAKNDPVKKTTKKIEKKPEKKIKIKETAKTKEVKKLEKTPEKKVEKKSNQIAVAKTTKKQNQQSGFKVGDYAVYPSHGIGKITEIEKTMILGQEFNCYLMHFEREKLTVKIPTISAEKVGLRPLISKSQMDEVFSILRSGVKKLKGMWSRRAQEYETKINSGDIISLAEVLRDLTRDIEDSERSYSERIIYETAIYRLASEYSAIYGIDFEIAKEKVTATAKDKLNSDSPKSAKKDEFDDFDLDEEENDSEEEEEDDEEEEDIEEEDDSEDYDDEDEDD